MDTVRLMDTPEDYARLGVQPGEVQVWEDQRSSEPRPGAWEWWYFDAILDDGTQTVIQFFTKSKDTVNDAVDHPTATIKVTLPDGTLYQRADERPLTETDWGEGRAAVRIGPHRFEGDLRTYHIRVDPIDGVGADLHVTSQSKPYRPGTAYFGFGERDEDYFTWLCAVPKAEVSGTLTVDGRVVEVHGRGYHDHQWGTTNYLALWNHWLWARQGFEDYSILVFDLVTSQCYGFTQFPICFIQDAEGNLVFENTGELAGCELREIHHDEASGKDYPRSTRYVFDHDGTQVVYVLRADRVIDRFDAREHMPQEAWEKLAKAGVYPTYARYSATGELRLTHRDVVQERSGQLIYEFMYPGTAPFAEHTGL